MQRSIDLALNGLGHVSPNPLVGAVVVNDGKIIGEGWHRQYGQPHAEVNALSDCERNGAGHLLPHSEMYVTLEPCAHHGKTPPCTDLIIEKKIPKVLIGCQDPYEQVNGQGIHKLREAGIEVVTEVLMPQCRDLNRRFMIFQERHRPYIILKFARTEDGFLAPDSQDEGIFWISNDWSRLLVHRWRSEEDAVLVGYKTALLDNPHLTVRSWSGRSPLRIVLDPELHLPATLNLFNGETRTVILNSVRSERKDNVEYLRLDGTGPVAWQVCRALHALQVQSVIVEGGRRLLEEFSTHGCWDEARIFTAPKMLGKGLAAPLVSGELMSARDIAGDKLTVIKNKFQPSWTSAS